MLWAFPAAGAVMGGASIAHGMVFFGTGFGFGEHTEAGPTTNPLSLFSATEAHYLYALAPIGGT